MRVMTLIFVILERSAYPRSGAYTVQDVVNIFENPRVHHFSIKCKNLWKLDFCKYWPKYFFFKNASDIHFMKPNSNMGGVFLVFNSLNRLLDLVPVCLDRLFKLFQFNQLNRNSLNRWSSQIRTKSNSLFLSIYGINNQKCPPIFELGFRKWNVTCIFD